MYRVIEHTRMPIFPIKPDRRKILLMGIVLALAIGIGASITIELIDRSLRNVQQID